MRSLAKLYAAVDLRALAAGRVALALVLLFDLAKRVPGISTWYSNQGLLPNHTLLWRPSFDPVFSPFFMASHTWEAALGFAICGVAYMALLLGWRTKAAQVASLLAVLALHGRVLFLQNGGDVVLSLLALWTVFLPTGERYSIDAWLRDRAALEGKSSSVGEQHVSLGFTALLLQLTVIYAFNAVHKNGVTWHEGSVVHYVLHQDRIVTGLGVWVRDRLPVVGGQWLTWSALGIEGILPLLLLSPWSQRWCRRAAATLVIVLHIGFALFLNLGVFSVAMMAFTPNLLLAADWDRFDRWRAGHRPAWYAPWCRRVFLWIAIADAYLPRVHAKLSARPRWREPAVAMLMILALSQVLIDNRAVPAKLKPQRARFVEASITYLQLFQGWSMFAPNAPRTDSTVIVDALTKSGRHVDPLSEAAAPRHARAERVVAPQLDHDSFFCDYISRIADKGSYHRALIEWIERYPQRTGRKSDAIVSFDLIELSDESPPPGETQPRQLKTKIVLSHQF